MDSILSTSFRLRHDMSLNQIFQECFIPWLRNASNRNYFFKDLPNCLPSQTFWESGRLYSNGDFIECFYLNVQDNESFGVELSYTSQSIRWVTKVSIKKTKDKTYSFVSLQRECLVQGVKPFKPKSPNIVASLMVFSEPDGCFDILDTAHVVEACDLLIPENIFKGKTNCTLPIIYMSIANTKHILIPDKLAKEMRGLAHIVKEESNGVYEGLKNRKISRFPKNGEIGIYYPGSNRPRILERRDREEWIKHPESMTDFLFKNLAEHSLFVKPLYSWEILKNDIDFYHREQFEKNKSKFASETERYLAEIAELKRQLKQKDEDAENLKHDNQMLMEMCDESDDKAKRIPELEAKLRAFEDQLNRKSIGKNIELKWPDKMEQLFQNEILLTVLMAMKYFLGNMGKGGRMGSFASRPVDVVEAILKNYKDEIAEYERQRDVVLNASEKGEWKNANKALQYFGMERYVKENNHKGFRFVKDIGRYSGTAGSTPSDNARGRKNEAAAIDHVFFMPSK